MSNLLGKIIYALAGLVILTIIVAIGGYLYYNAYINAPIDTGEDQIHLTIERGMGVNEISDLLVEKQLISNPMMLKAYLYLNKDKSIDAGNYTIPSEGLTLAKLVDSLQDGSFEYRLTFIEGWRVEEYQDYLEKVISKEFADEFMQNNFIREGYMFPDTYTIEEGYDPADLASWMRNTFDKRFTPQMVDQAGLRGLSPEEVVILASILEREMHIKKDRPIVAGILVKRLREGWALNADATIQYAKGSENNWWPVVTRADYQGVNSPYNTYTSRGLPPGPICNPGLDAIQSVVNYQETPYWFYLTGSDGVTYYAETLEEHNANVARHL